MDFPEAAVYVRGHLKPSSSSSLIRRSRESNTPRPPIRDPGSQISNRQQLLLSMASRRTKLDVGSRIALAQLSFKDTSKGIQQKNAEGFEPYSVLTLPEIAPMRAMLGRVYDAASRNSFITRDVGSSGCGHVASHGPLDRARLDESSSDVCPGIRGGDAARNGHHLI